MARPLPILELPNIHPINISFTARGLNILHIAAFEYLLLVDVDALAMLFHFLIKLAKVNSPFILFYFEARPLYDRFNVEGLIHALIPSKVI